MRNFINGKYLFIYEVELSNPPKTLGEMRKQWWIFWGLYSVSFLWEFLNLSTLLAFLLWQCLFKEVSCLHSSRKYNLLCRLQLVCISSYSKESLPFLVKICLALFSPPTYFLFRCRPECLTCFLCEPTLGEIKVSQLSEFPVRNHNSF